MEKWTCPKCNKTYEKETKSKLQGVINLHSTRHCPSLFKDQEPPKEEGSNECLHSFRPLQAAGKEQLAINDGWKEVCKKCQDLR